MRALVRAGDGPAVLRPLGRDRQSRPAGPCGPAGRQQPEHGLRAAGPDRARRGQGPGQGVHRPPADREPRLGHSDLCRRAGLHLRGLQHEGRRDRGPGGDPAGRSRGDARRQALDLAKEACRRVPSPPNKQIVLLSDQQAGQLAGAVAGRAVRRSSPGRCRSSRWRRRTRRTPGSPTSASWTGSPTSRARPSSLATIRFEGRPRGATCR